MPNDAFTSLLSHFTSWNDLAGRPAVVTYSFAADGPAGFAPFSAQQQASARSALAAWDSISGLSFVEVPDAPGGAGIDLRFRLEPMSSVTILGQTDLAPDGDVALNIALFRLDSLAPSATRIGYQTLLHEIGHGLGLAHPAANTPGAAQNTIMVTTLGQTMPVNAPLAWDRAAIQSLYGTQEAETLHWSWDPSLGAVRGDGTADNDVMTGTAFRDALFGGAGTDLLRGGAGNDLLTPGQGDDVVEGGAGFDTLALGVTRSAMRLNPAGAVGRAGQPGRYHRFVQPRSMGARCGRAADRPTLCRLPGPQSGPHRIPTLDGGLRRRALRHRTLRRLPLQRRGRAAWASTLGEPRGIAGRGPCRHVGTSWRGYRLRLMALVPPR
jgi:hypothetical protein